ncbi:WD40 repeat-like protein [Piedraia hortae CBS 480.64]|uniref:WD40 repeat-like protein n=1 Tax=Piedraia hortae CBS 480.64 TaxID=1314780 RepID=A0A6A7BT75_9PEZI|nr:WD40 repeat-like protein [Piedraia hortae CBS 480.64]
MATQPALAQRNSNVVPPSAAGAAPQAAAAAGGNNPATSQDLNQIVIEYLAKRGYSRTEAMLRKESANLDSQGLPIEPRLEDRGGAKYAEAFNAFINWVDRGLEAFKPELRRILWPLFVYSYLDAHNDGWSDDAHKFFQRFKDRFMEEFSDYLIQLQSINEKEHLKQNELAQRFLNDRYRVYLSTLTYGSMINFMETKSTEGGSVLLQVMQDHIDIQHMPSLLGGTRSLQKMMDEEHGEFERPPPDEGLPDHRPGGIHGASRHLPDVNAKEYNVRLGQLPMDAEYIEDVKDDLRSLDVRNPPGPGKQSLVEYYEQGIKQEPSDDPVPAGSIPFPPKTARDVMMEVQRVRENRDRFRIEGKTGGVGPGVSVTMFTFHNTFDSVNCIEFSGDHSMVAIGSAESYIRVFSMNGKPLAPPDGQHAMSQRLVGHSGPVYGLSFSTSRSLKEGEDPSEGRPRYLLSCSADCTIRLWLVDSWTNLVVYRGHTSPVWDVRFSPHGHYFLSGSADRTARLWSTPEVQALRILVGHDNDVEAIAWHPNGAYVFTGSGVGDRSVRMWELLNGNRKRQFNGHTGNVTAVSCAPSGAILASADDKGEIFLWDIARQSCIKRMRSGSRLPVWSLDWSVESTVLVSGGANKAVCVWDVKPINEGSASKANGDSLAAKAAENTALATRPAKSKDKANGPTPDLISIFHTKQSPVYKVEFTLMNLIVAGGAYLPGGP